MRYITSMFFLLLMACSNVQYIIDDRDAIALNDAYPRINEILSENKSIILLTGIWSCIPVELSNKNELIYKGKIQTDHSTGLGTSEIGLLTVHKNEKVLLQINNKQQIILEVDKLKDFDFIYIDRQIKKRTYNQYKNDFDFRTERYVDYEITFSNRLQPFR